MAIEKEKREPVNLIDRAFEEAFKHAWEKPEFRKELLKRLARRGRL